MLKSSGIESRSSRERGHLLERGRAPSPVSPLVPSGEVRLAAQRGAGSDNPTERIERTLNHSQPFLSLVAAGCRASKLKTLVNQVLRYGSLYGYQKSVRAAGDVPWSRTGSLLKKAKLLAKRAEDLARDFDDLNNLLPPPQGGILIGEKQRWFGEQHETDGRAALPGLSDALRKSSAYLRSWQYGDRAESVKRDYEKRFIQGEIQLVRYVEDVSQRKGVKIDQFAIVSSLLDEGFRVFDQVWDEAGRKAGRPPRPSWGPPLSYKRKAFQVRVERKRRPQR